MRKIISTLFIAILTFFVFTFSASAALTHKATFVIGKTSYTVGSQTKQMDAKTFIKNNRTYVPVRYLGDALGAKTNWYGETRTITVTLDSAVIKLVIGSKTLYVNGQARQMDVAPVTIKGRTYLPARWVAEALGYQTTWEPVTQTVYIGPPEDDNVRSIIPTELEVREKIPDLILKFSDLDHNPENIRNVIDACPGSWPAGMFIVHYCHQEGWVSGNAQPDVSFYLMVKTLGGILYIDYGVANVYFYKNLTDIKGRLDYASDGSTICAEVWRNSNKWLNPEIWDREFWMLEDNFLGIY